MANNEALRAFRKQRQDFKQLIAKNPNHFGTLKESPFPVIEEIQGNTYYEELTCVGFNFEMNLLEATIDVKREFGYSGDLCTKGSMEYVRFFVDYGAGWVDVGVAAFNTHDIPKGLDCAKEQDKPLSYVVRLPLEAPQEDCEHPLLPRVRAILSWEIMPPPGVPNWTQVWGNTLECHIQLRALKPVLLPTLPPGLDELVAVKMEPLALATLAKRYNPASRSTVGRRAVEPHRFAMAEISATLSPGLNPEFIAAKAAEFEKVGIDWPGTVEDLEKTKGDVSYEELTCLGLDRKNDWLVATFVIKKPAGYGGDLCEKGSFEYVSFWADWDDKCEWKHMGMVKLAVHDIVQIPNDGLRYWVGVKVDLSDHQQLCKTPKTGRVRAVLSWGTPPSSADPDALPTWGNRLDRHVEIKPLGGQLPAMASIDIIGGINVGEIDVGPLGDGRTVSNAVFAEWGGPADPYVPTRTCPFGGRVNIQADVPDVFVTNSCSYRVLYRQAPSLVNPSPTPMPVTDRFQVSNGTSNGWRYPDPTTGWIDYIQGSQNVFNMLAWWETRNLASGLYEIKLEMQCPTIVSSTAWLRVEIDNRSPTAAIQIDHGGDCKDFVEGTNIMGHFVARDPNFGHFTLDTTPDSKSPPDPITTIPVWSQTVPAPGNPWFVNTTGMKPCGYTVTVRAWDRTILNSRPNRHNSAKADTGLCLRKKTPSE